LNEIGLSCHKPEGAFYAYPSIKATGLSSMEFASRLLKEKNVAVVPGTAFSPVLGDLYIRISYASSLGKLKEALDRMETFLLKIKEKRRIA
jgi:aminotransferase